MSDPSTQAKLLLSWFDEHAGPFLKEHGSSWFEDLDRRAKALKRASSALATTSDICFLGNSGVGKSTLINALIAKGGFVVPSGGVGPLTAAALAVHHGTHPRLEVRYHPPRDVWQLAFALEAALRKTGAKPQIDEPLGGPDPRDPEVQPDPATDVEDAPTVGDLEERFRGVARLLVTGNQNSDDSPQYLIDGLREITGNRRIWGTAIRPEHVEYIKAARDALALAKTKGTLVIDGETTDSAVVLAIHEHAAGNLAPLVMEMDVAWRSEMLRDGLVLVDLPGLGIAHDVHKELTRKWIRERAAAVALVVDHRGVTDAVVDLLRRSEFLNRLLYYRKDEARDRPSLMIAVVRVDEIAETRWQQQTTAPKRSKVSFFEQVCQEAEHTVREQLRSCLRSVWTTDDADGDAEEAKQEVIATLVSEVYIQALSAAQYRKIEAGDPDDPSFLPNPEASRLPRLRTALMSMATGRRESARSATLALIREFRVNALEAIRYVEVEWGSDQRVRTAVEEAQRELDVVLAPRREEFRNRQGEFRAFLNKTVPARISGELAEAGRKAERKIAAYLKRLGEAHWATLRASVRREGRFSGAMDINLPHEFALRFEEPVAESWSTTILQAIRQETRDFGKSVQGLVDVVLEWAIAQGPRLPQDRVDAVSKKIRNGMRDVDRVGREMVDDLRDHAQRSLLQAIESPIRRKCRDFVDKNADVGRGVKQRILDLYVELAGEVVDIAVAKSQDILGGLYKEVQGEIANRFKGLDNPLDDVSEAIIDTNSEHRGRSDAQRRGKILKSIESIRAELPPEAPPTL